MERGIGGGGRGRGRGRRGEGDLSRTHVGRHGVAKPENIAKTETRGDLAELEARLEVGLHQKIEVWAGFGFSFRV